MPELKATPGPWQIVPDANHRGNCRVISFHPVAIAKVYADEPVDGDEKAIANAHLIAAAPSLYEALDAVKEASLFVDDDGQVRVTDEPYISHELFATICDALAKARGESV